MAAGVPARPAISLFYDMNIRQGVNWELRVSADEMRSAQNTEKYKITDVTTLKIVRRGTNLRVCT